MSKGMQLLGIIILSMITLAVVYLMNDVRSTAELDYYLLQEVTEASMYDAVDLSYYRNTGLLKVDRDMFLESFNRRFAQSVDVNRTYNIKIIDFNETPPKVSIEVQTSSIASVKGETAVVTTRVSGIIESIYDDFHIHVPLAKDGVGDAVKPAIVPDSATSVLISDNMALGKYCLGYIKDGDNIGDLSKFECESWANAALGEKEYLVDYTDYDYYVDKPGYKKAIVVYDRAGNWASSTIIYTGPIISLSLDYHEMFYFGNLKINITDFYDFNSYTIKVDGRSIISESIRPTKNNKKYIAEKLITYFYRDYMLNGEHEYTVSVTNTAGISGSNSFTYDKKLTSKPTIAVSEPSKSNKTVQVTFNDQDGDLKYYAYTSKKYTIGSNADVTSAIAALPSVSTIDSSNWKAVSTTGTQTLNTKTITLDYNENTAYYIYAVDSVGNYASKAIIYRASVGATPTCTKGDPKKVGTSYTCEYNTTCKEGTKTTSYWDSCASRTPIVPAHYECDGVTTTSSTCTYTEIATSYSCCPSGYSDDDHFTCKKPGTVTTVNGQNFCSGVFDWDGNCYDVSQKTATCYKCRDNTWSRSGTTCSKTVNATSVPQSGGDCVGGQVSSTTTVYNTADVDNCTGGWNTETDSSLFSYQCDSEGTLNQTTHMCEYY